ncbi:hypothetical protein [Pseudomonas sp. PAMC 25886]|uniref:hypothetical protein n=1 Tax=Pseudomonas sp. PAMC 25886 TaxID=1125977 RepID=UPI0002880A15|nr:hypothetical protein [Pseudomonas sp. PAMC 25886]
MSESTPLALNLYAPWIVEAGQGATTVPSRLLLKGATIEVCYKDMNAEDLIRVFWESTFGDYAPIEPLYGVEDGCVEFYIPPLYVGMRLDNFTHFYYTVTREGEEYRSPTVTVRIPLPDNLTRPYFDQLPHDILDIGRYCEDPVIHVDPWDFIGTTQLTMLYMSGINPDGTKVRIELFKDEPVTEEEVRNGWSRRVPREILASLKHDSEFYAYFLVEYMPRREGGREVYRGFPGRVLTLLTEDHLELPPPSVVEAVELHPGGSTLNPAHAEHGANLRISYDHMCPCDWICAYWEGTPGEGTPALTCTFAGDAAFVTIPVPASAIVANLCETVPVSYTVLRRGRSWASPARPVRILGTADLPLPEVLQSTGPVLDLNTFTDDAEATVVPWPFIAAGQPCDLWVTGELEGGGNYRFDVLEGVPVSEKWLNSGVSALLLRHELQRLADCSDFTVHFAVRLNDQADNPCAKKYSMRTLNIVQADLVLKAPTVREAVGSELTAYNGREGVTLRVQYDHISPYQSIQPCWQRADGSCLPLAAKPGNSTPGYVDFHIPREAVIHAIGNTVPINYTVTSRCKLATSPALKLHVSFPGPNILPPPVIPQAVEGVLDLRTFEGDANATVAQWWFILEHQNGWLNVAGTKEDGTPYVIQVMIGEAVTAQDVANGLDRILKRSELLLLRNLTSLRVTYECTPDDSTHRSDAIMFPVAEYIFTKPFEDLSDFDSSADLNGWQRGPAATDPRDLVFYREENGNGCLWNYTYTQISNGVLLFKSLTGFEVGRRYSFSIEVKRFNLAGAVPRMSLSVNQVPITAQTDFPTMVWVQLVGTFTATSPTMDLDITSHVFTGQGNDYLLDKIYVREV